MFDLQLALFKLQFLLLHLHHWVLRLLLRLLLGLLLLVNLQRLLGCLGKHLGQRLLNFRGKLLIVLGQGHTQLLFNLLAVQEPGMLGYVRHERGSYGLCIGVLPNGLHHYRVLGQGHVHRHVRLVVLVEERLDRFHLENCHVLPDRIDRLHVFWQRHKFGGVLYPQNLQHIAVQLGHVVNVRRRLGHLHDRLILHNPLAQSGCVGVADRDYVHMVVVFFLGFFSAFFWRVVVVRVRVVPNNRRQKPQFLFERVVQPRLNRRHHLQTTLKNCQRSAHRGVGRHVACLHIRRGRKVAPFLDDLI